MVIMYTSIETASTSDIAVSIKEKEIVSSEASLTLDDSFRNMRKSLSEELHIEDINPWEQSVGKPHDSEVTLRTKYNK